MLIHVGKVVVMGSLGKSVVSRLRWAVEEEGKGRKRDVGGYFVERWIMMPNAPG